MVVALTILAIAALVLGSYLVLVQTQTNSVSRSQTWNSAIAITEAGLEEGLAEVNRFSPTVGSNSIDTSPWGWTNNITQDGWSIFTNGQTSLTRNVSTNNAGTNGYTVMIDTSSGTPTITSAGFVAFTSTAWAAYGAPQPFLAAGGVTTATNLIIGRRVQVQTVLSPLFSCAFIIKSNLTMSGNGTTIDSFDSSNTNYSTGGQWDVNKRKAGGNVATDSAIVNLSIGNGNIYGHVYTGPGTLQSQVSVGSQGAVGDVAWNASHSGIEPGFWAGNFNTAIPDVPTPTFVGGALPGANTNGPLKGSIVLSGGHYTVPSGGPSAPLVITAPTSLWVQGSFSPAGITCTNSGSLVLYLGTTSTNGSDSFTCGSINTGGLAVNLQIFGLPSLTSITLSGNDNLAAAIYAPEATFTGNGGGSSGEFEGSLVVQSITLHGHFNIHYDESLVSSGASRGWIAKGWTELKY